MKTALPTSRTLAILTLAFGAAGTAVAYQPGKILCRFQDKQIDESSGLSTSARTDDYFFTHNDSGDGPFIYAINRSGATLATLRLRGAVALDWEDMARGPGKDGSPALYVGDIGDNLEFRQRITLYRVPEPKIDTKRTGLETTLISVEKFQLQYEDGPHNAETLLVHPKTGQVFIITKSPGECGIYAAPTNLSTKENNQLRRLAKFQFPIRTAKNAPGGFPPNAPGAKTTTGGDISPDGKRLVVRTYTDAYEWQLNGSTQLDMQAAVSRPPRHVRLPNVLAGEAICYTRKGDSLLLSEEGKGAAIYELRR